MTHPPSIGVPELAGLASYEAAARIGYSVDENVRRLLRYQWTERRLMIDLLSHLTAEPVWEVKCGYALISGRRRARGLAAPGIVDAPPGAAPGRRSRSRARALLQELDARRTPSSARRQLRRRRAALAAAYREHLATTNPLVDQNRPEG